MYFDWQDELLVSEPLDTIDSTKFTIRFPCRPVAAIGFNSIAEMMVFRFADILPYGDHWDQERMCVVVDPCSDPETLQDVGRGEDGHRTVQRLWCCGARPG
jgi:hypothetical protein